MARRKKPAPPIGTMPKTADGWAEIQGRHGRPTLRHYIKKNTALCGAVVLYNGDTTPADGIPDDLDCQRCTSRLANLKAAR